MLIYLGVVAAIVASAFAYIIWRIDDMARDLAETAVAKKDAAAAQHLADEAVKAQETRDAVARSDFSGAVDDL
jgi:RNA-splicing ligase RtcB